MRHVGDAVGVAFEPVRIPFQIDLPKILSGVAHIASADHGRRFGQLRHTVRRRRNDDELVAPGFIGLRMALKEIEFEQSFIHPEIAPRIDEERGHVDGLGSLVVGKLRPPRIGEIVPQDIFPVGIGHADALHHVDHRQSPEQRLERIGFDDRLGPRRELIGDLAEFIRRQPRWRSPEHLAAAADHPFFGRRQLKGSAIEGAEVAVALAGRADGAARGLRNHGGQGRRTALRQPHLRIARVRASVGAHFAVRPRLLG